MSNLLQYQSLGTDSPSLSKFTETYNREYSLKKIKKKETNISNSFLRVFKLMCIYVSVYLNSETLKLSSLISSKSYNQSTIGVYVYDLLLTIFIVLPLIKMTEIKGITFKSILYFIFCNIGGLGFALLGEVPFLKNIVIVKNFWKNLSPGAIGTIIFFAVIILIVLVREVKSIIKYRTICRPICNILAFIGFYIGIFYMLAEGGATNIHWHIHHAICAGFLSLWFTNWENWIEMCTHAVLMGVVVEGINFYGINELYLFLSKDGILVKYGYSFFVSGVFLFLIALSYIIRRMWKLK